MVTLFRGARSVRTDLTTFIGSKLPGYIATFERVTGASLARPERLEAYENVAIAHGERCIMGISIGSSDEMTTVDWNDDGSREYRTRYDVQLYTWCTTKQDEDGTTPNDTRVMTLADRDDIAGCIRGMLLDNPHLGFADGRYELIESTLSEEYSTSEPVGNPSGRWIAGVVHNFSIRVEESLYREVEYVAEFIVTDVELMDDED